LVITMRKSSSLSKVSISAPDGREIAVSLDLPPSPKKRRHERDSAKAAISIAASGKTGSVRTSKAVPPATAVARVDDTVNASVLGRAHPPSGAITVTPATSVATCSSPLHSGTDGAVTVVSSRHGAATSVLTGSVVPAVVSQPHATGTSVPLTLPSGSDRMGRSLVYDASPSTSGVRGQGSGAPSSDHPASGFVQLMDGSWLPTSALPLGTVLPGDKLLLTPSSVSGTRSGFRLRLQPLSRCLKGFMLRPLWLPLRLHCLLRPGMRMRRRSLVVRPLLPRALCPWMMSLRPQRKWIAVGLRFWIWRRAFSLKRDGFLTPLRRTLPSTDVVLAGNCLPLCLSWLGGCLGVCFFRYTLCFW
jgi:hypothetical protein